MSAGFGARRAIRPAAPAVLALALGLLSALPATAQPPADDGEEQSFVVFLRSRPVGQESVAVRREADGWIVRGSNSLGPPLNVVIRTAEVRYDAAWRPTRLRLEGSVGGEDMVLETAFADERATSAITIADKTEETTDEVTADTIVLPNTFLGSYAALARRLTGLAPGAELRGYIAPQGEVGLRLDATFQERVETPRGVIAATRYALTVSNQTPAGDLQISVWADPEGDLLRLSVPAQMLELAREDVASAAARTTAFSIPGDESVHIPASGFNLAASVSKPAGVAGPLPALILVGGSGLADRDGVIAGVPVLGHLAAELSKAGFLVVRYDRRGVGQSGGRAESATLQDHAEDVRAVISWLERARKDVNRRRIGLVGHGEGAWIAMLAAARDRRIRAVALASGAATTGAELVLDQQRDVLDRLNTPEAEKQAKIALQRRIHEATLEGGSWEGVPDVLRAAADTPWFQSFLAFDPSRVMRDVRQPVFVVHGALDTQTPPRHGEGLAELGRARRRKVPTDLTVVPGVNHLLVPAKTGGVDEYPALGDATVSSAVTTAIAEWMQKHLR